MAVIDTDENDSLAKKLRESPSCNTTLIECSHLGEKAADEDVRLLDGDPRNAFAKKYRLPISKKRII